MNVKNLILVLMLIVLGISCEEFNFKKSFQYSGEKFPAKYLVPDDTIPTISDLNYYLRSLKRTVGYFHSYPNYTDANVALALFYTKSLLKRTLLDSKKNLGKYQLMTVVDMINKADYAISHFIYAKVPYGWKDIEYRVSRLLTDDTPQVHSISEFNRNRLKVWILTKDNINDFIEQLDDATFPKEKYVGIAESMDDYFLISDSDACISRISYNPEPINVTEVRKCRPDPMCSERTLARPSVAYALSHRLLITMALRQIRRCSHNSVEFDDLLMDLMCANMYREAVYIARRGYFARDIFLEHVGFCSMLGYEEFHRRNWFHKAASWLNKDGCIQENFNFEVNRSRFIEELYRNKPKELKRILKARDFAFREKCHSHPMAVLVIFLANAVRHAAHFMSKTAAQS